jgi:hypothetical protein
MSGLSTIFVMIEALTPREMSGLTPENVRIVASRTASEKNREKCQDHKRHTSVSRSGSGYYSRKKIAEVDREKCQDPGAMHPAERIRREKNERTRRRLN